VRNTVDDAVSAFHELKKHEGKGGVNEVKLFHARMAACDRAGVEAWVLDHFGPESTAEQRAGRILVATQVVEQSLDVDFDAFASDLAPADLLVQREGRQHRHRRRSDGSPAPSGENDQRPDATFCIFAPKLAEDAEAWLKAFDDLFPKARYVYPHVGVLWRTQRALAELKRIAIPEKARTLVEVVYAPDVPEASDLPGRWSEDPSAWAIPQALRKRSAEAVSEQKKYASQAHANALSWAAGYDGLEAGAALWMDDKHTPTRLGEPTVTLRLASTDGEGKHLRLYPWACADLADYDKLLADLRTAATPDARRKARNALADAWTGSDLNVRESMLSKPPTWTGKEKGADDRAFAEMPDGGKWTRLVSVGDDGAVRQGDKKNPLAYAKQTGLTRAK
jgi:CRISPR-associated endonuclease/helicase Cas3